MRRQVYLFSSLVVTIAVLSYVFSHISPADVWNLIKGANEQALAAFFVLSFAMSFFRTWRYKLLLNVIGYHPSPSALFLVVLVRNFFSDLLPARIGTLVYIFILTGRLGIPLDAATSSFALAFLFDLIAITPLMIVALLASGPVGEVPSVAVVTLSLVLAAVFGVLIALLPHLFKLCARFSENLPFIKENSRHSLAKLCSEVQHKIEGVRSAGVYGQVMVLSIFVRFGKYGGLYVFLYSLLQPLGYGLEDLPFSKVFLGLVVPELSASLPISGIAGFGAYQGAWILIFQLLGFPEHIAHTTAVSHHLFTQAYGCILGLSALILLMLPVYRSTQIESPGESIPRSGTLLFFMKIILSLLSIGVLLYISSYFPLS